MSFPNPFKTTDGRIVIAQFPNTPLILAAIFYFLSRLPNQYLPIYARWGYRACLVYWAYLEITSGVNLWRRFLGLSVVIYLIINIAH